MNAPTVLQTVPPTVFQTVPPTVLQTVPPTVLQTVIPTPSRRSRPEIHSHRPYVDPLNGNTPPNHRDARPSTPDISPEENHHGFNSTATFAVEAPIDLNVRECEVIFGPHQPRPSRSWCSADHKHNRHRRMHVDRFRGQASGAFLLSDDFRTRCR